MQMRERGRQIELLRSSYRADLGRSRVTRFASIPVDCAEVPSAVARQLSDYEMAQLRQWREARAERLQQDEYAAILEAAGELLQEAAEAITEAHAPPSRGEVSAIWAGIDALQKSLKRNGFPRPQRPRRTPKSDRRQTRLQHMD